MRAFPKALRLDFEEMRKVRGLEIDGVSALEARDPSATGTAKTDQCPLGSVVVLVVSETVNGNLVTWKRLTGSGFTFMQNEIGGPLGASRPDLLRNQIIKTNDSASEFL